MQAEISNRPMHIVILGNGISGITAARFIRKKSAHRITVISSEAPHFFSRTALMYLYMGHLRFKDIKPYEDGFWEKNRIELVRKHVTGIQFENKRLIFKDAGQMAYDKLILAVGSVPNKFGWPGQDLRGVRGMYTIQDVLAIEKASIGLKRAVIVGGGLIGIELAEMFHSRHIPVTFLVREDSFWNGVLPPEESHMINRHIREHGIDLRLQTELREILDNGTGQACGVRTSTGERIDCGFVGLTAGVRPNIDFLKDSGLEVDKGILVNAKLETNIPDIYAIGDCAQQRQPRPGRRAIEAVWYAGRIQGEVVAYQVCGAGIDYDPGVWFNSAKFFDIEYQVYGYVPNRHDETVQQLYWEHPGGKKSIRLIYDKDTQVIRGFNLMGVRYRHEVCARWIRQKTKIGDVLANLPLANFDAELSDTFEAEIIQRYTQLTGQEVRTDRRRSWNQVFSFLSGSNP